MAEAYLEAGGAAAPQLPRDGAPRGRLSLGNKECPQPTLEAKKKAMAEAYHSASWGHHDQN